MPEKRDETFTLALVEEIKRFARAFGIYSFDLEIKEKYTDESTPHYHCHISSDGLLGGPATETSVTYTATKTDENRVKETHAGEVTLRLKTTGGSATKDLYIILGAFPLYHECVVEYYPEWKTLYNEPSPPHRD
jgi:hypothetical protein